MGWFSSHARPEFTDNVSIQTIAGMVDQTIYNADRPVKVVSVHLTITTAGAGGTFRITKCTGTTAPASGTSVFSESIGPAPLDDPANVVTNILLTTNQSVRQLNVGDRLAVDFQGTVGVAHIQIRVESTR